jgi:hypothetical protein
LVLIPVGGEYVVLELGLEEGLWFGAESEFGGALAKLATEYVVSESGHLIAIGGSLNGATGIGALIYAHAGC